jgi:energy-coupling factor transport system permease protein
MKGNNFFFYNPGSSIIHKLDPRTKLLSLIVYSVLIVYAVPYTLIMITALLTTCLLLERLSFITVLAGIKPFLPLLFLVFVAAALSRGGGAGGIVGKELLESGALSRLKWGIVHGALVSWRLLLLILLTTAVLASTRIGEVRKAVVSLTRSHNLGLMISLTLGMVPLILRTAADIKEAQKARSIGLCRNPARRIKLFVLPLFFDIFHRSDDMSAAMEARCYSPRRTELPLFFHLRDFFVLIITGCFLYITFFCDTL